MKHFYTYPEAAEELGISLATVRGAVIRKSLRSQTDPANRAKRYITKTALESYRKKMRKSKT